MINQDFREKVSRYYNNNLIKHVFNKLDDYKEEIISNWKELARIYSPSGGEIGRAKYILEKFKETGILETTIDETGNVIGLIKGKHKGPCIAFVGTMDDMIRVAKRVNEWNKPILEKNGMLVGPGTFIIGSCVSIIGLAKLFSLPEIEFNGKIYLVGLVKEAQNLGGIKGFLKDHEGEIDYLIDVMGGIGRMYYGALGITMLKVHFKGPGGHTLSGGLPNVTRGIAKAIDKIYSIPLPSEIEEKKFIDFEIGKIDLSGHYLNISMVNASDVINHKSENGWFTVDLRSINKEVQESIKTQIQTIVEQVAKEENLGWQIEIINDIPAAQLPDARNSRLVKIAEEVIKLFEPDIFISNMGSTNMNIGILNQIPSIMVAGKEGGNRDTPEEYGNIKYIMLGIKTHFLIGFILTSGKFPRETLVQSMK